MVKSGKLSIDEKEIVEQSYSQAKTLAAVLSIIFSIILLTAIYAIPLHPSLEGVRIESLLFAKIVIPISYITVLVLTLRKPFLDNKSKEKNIISGKIKNKTFTTKWMYRSVLGDNTSPTLQEYFIQIQNSKYQINKESYCQLEIDDEVQLSYSKYGDTLLSVLKENTKN